MKKKLPNQKRVSTLFLILFLTFLGVNSVSSQTIVNETFGSAALAAPYVGGTSTTPSGITYTQGSNGSISTVLNGTDAYLNFASNGTNGKPYLTAPFSDLAPGFNAASLTSNTKLITWTVNMRASRSMSSSSNTYVDGSYYLAAVLCSSNPNLVDGTTSGSVGYALILQRSIDNPLSLNPGAVRLVKFQNGIGSSATTGSIVSAALLTTPALNAGAVATAAAPNNVSIKVEYNADFDSWTMYYREDPTTAPITFADPSTGSYTKIGTITDATYTATPMTHFGYLASVALSASTANQFQMDNFKIALSDFPAFTPTPNIEKRQAIHNTPSPTVASLANVGTDVKYYAAATGGVPLLSTTPISTGYYYVTQTIAGTESERLATYVYVGDTTLRTLPVYEPFNYPVSTASTASTDNKLVLINNDLVSVTGYGTWSVATTVLPTVLSPDDMVLAPQPTVWSSSILPAPTGNALTFDKSGLDPQLLFEAPTTGSVYASCLVQVTNLNAITSGTSGTSLDTPAAPSQIFSFAYADPAAGSQTSYTAAVYLKSSTITPGAFNIGINAAPADPIGVSDIFWDVTDYAINTPITLVIQYSYDNNISKLWINPTSSTEPAATATTLARTLPIAVNRVRLNQTSTATTPFVTIDEIRVADNWGQAVGGTLGIESKETKASATIYPNPVKEGKLYISSSNANEKQVSIYSILGQKVIDVKTNNTISEINVSKLSKGNYILKISEDGKSEVKKLIIQ